MKYQITAVIPARREEETIEDTLAGLCALPIPVEIVVVSDRVGNEDRTEDIVTRFAASRTNIRLLKKKPRDRNGFAATLKRGITAVRTPFTVFVMADLCDDPDTIPVMYRKAMEGYDVACGSRYMAGGKRIGGPFLQGISSTFINSCMRIITGIPTHDASNSFKMYRTALLCTLPMDANAGSEVSLSLVFAAWKKHARITEVPTLWKGRERGNAKFRLYSQILRYTKACILAINQNGV